jgi:hypothetical protein
VVVSHPGLLTSTPPRVLLDAVGVHLVNGQRRRRQAAA